MTNRIIGGQESIRKLQAFTTAVSLAQNNAGDGESLVEWTERFAATCEWGLVNAPQELPRQYVQLIHDGVGHFLAALASIAGLDDAGEDEGDGWPDPEYLEMARAAPGRWRRMLHKISYRWLFGWQANPADFSSYAQWSYDEFVSSFRLMALTAQLDWMLLRRWPQETVGVEEEEEEMEVLDGEEEGEIEEEDEEESVAEVVSDEWDEEGGENEEEDEDRDGDERVNYAVAGAVIVDEEDEGAGTADDCDSLLDELALIAGLDPRNECAQELVDGLQARLEFSPVDVDSRIELAICLAQSGEYDDAIEHLLEIRLRRPENDTALKQLCYCLAASGRWEDATAEANKLITHKISEYDGNVIIELLVEAQEACTG
ncbi:MAG: tetratricopeptide repeat protein [Caldilineales bacterium]|nr:tetratricopeptide repeat protein [Caldilineales bacterium]